LAEDQNEVKAYLGNMERGWCNN
jgi:MFS family permease